VLPHERFVTVIGLSACRHFDRPFQGPRGKAFCFIPLESPSWTEFNPGISPRVIEVIAIICRPPVTLTLSPYGIVLSFVSNHFLRSYSLDNLYFIHTQVVVFRSYSQYTFSAVIRTSSICAQYSPSVNFRVRFFVFRVHFPSSNSVFLEFVHFHYFFLNPRAFPSLFWPFSFDIFSGRPPWECPSFPVLFSS